MKKTLTHHFIALFICLESQENVARADILATPFDSLEWFFSVNKNPYDLSKDDHFPLLPYHSIDPIVLPLERVLASSTEDPFDLSTLIQQIQESRPFQQLIPNISSHDVARDIEIPSPTFQRLELENQSFTDQPLSFFIVSLIRNFNNALAGQEAPYPMNYRSTLCLLNRFIIYYRIFPYRSLMNLSGEQVAMIHFMHAYIMDRLNRSSGGGADNHSTMASNQLLIDQYISFLLRIILNGLYDRHPTLIPWTNSIITLDSEITFHTLKVRKLLCFNDQKTKKHFKKQALPRLRPLVDHGEPSSLRSMTRGDLMNNDEYYYYLMKRMGNPLEDFETPLFTWQQEIAFFLRTLTCCHNPKGYPKRLYLRQKLFSLVRYCERLRLSFNREPTHQSNNVGASANSALQASFPSLENILTLEASITDIINSLEEIEHRREFFQQVVSMIDNLIRFANQLLEFLTENPRQGARFINESLINTHITNLQNLLSNLQRSYSDLTRP